MDALFPLLDEPTEQRQKNLMRMKEDVKARYFEAPVLKNMGDRKQLLRKGGMNLCILYIIMLLFYAKKGDAAMPQIMPITDLRKTNEISELCHRQNEPIFVTKNGYGDLVVMSIEAYEKLVCENHTDAAITEAEREMAEGGNLADAREMLDGLRRRYAK